jgi:hypothetical protein
LIQIKDPRDGEFYYNEGIHDDKNEQNKYTFYRDIGIGKKEKVVIVECNGIWSCREYSNKVKFYYDDWILQNAYGLDVSKY